MTKICTTYSTADASQYISIARPRDHASNALVQYAMWVNSKQVGSAEEAL